MRNLMGWGVLAVFASISERAWAESLTVQNHSFENISGESPYNEFTFGALNGWNLYESTPGQTSDGDGPNYYIGTLGPRTFGTQGGIQQYFPGGAPDGSRIGIAFNYASVGGGGEYGFIQQLSSTLQANVFYTLQVDVLNIGSGPSQDGTPFNLSGFPGYRIDLMAGTQVVASDDNSLATSLDDGEYGTSVINFQATGLHESLLGQALSIRLVNLNVVDPAHPGADLEVDFDNVRLDAVAVPEPATWGLLAVGFSALAYAMKRRR